MKALVPIFISLVSAVALGFTGQTLENFTTLTNLDMTNTTAVWNIASNRVHTPMTVCVGNGPPCTNNDETFDVDIGTGSDGVFDVPYYANFGTISGGPTNFILTINTNVHPFFNFTTFNLPSNWTIIGIGANPLWFKVQGTFTTAGIINCNGGAGSGVVASMATAPAGGVGNCGGANGGTGGDSASPDGQNGFDGGGPTLNTHGSGGTHSAASFQWPYGGGGGGSYGGGGSSGSPGAGTVVGPTPAPGGTVTNDYIMQYLGSVTNGPGSGSGGGGGGAYLPVDAHTSAGAGGGAGGGIIHIAAGGNFTQTATGEILAGGGNGGNGDPSLGGGAGGGGGGGTIIIHSGGTFVDNGQVLAPKGFGGTLGFGGNNGGNGFVGREWTASLGTFTGGGGESPAFNGPNPGEVHYKYMSSYVAQSLGYDSFNTSPTYAAFILTDSLPNTSTATLMIGGSSDNFVHDDTGFVPVTNMSQLAGKRYFRFQLQLQLAPSGLAEVTPAQVTAVNASYSGNKQSSFQFGPGCGTFGGPGEFIFDLFLCFFLGVLTSGRLRKDKLFRPSKTLLGS